MSEKDSILVVDDDPIVLQSCRMVLETVGYDVVLAASVDEALERLPGRSFRALVLDLKMPRRDGMHLVGWVLENRPDLPIVMMTGFSTPETIEEGYRKGASVLLAKPFTPKELLAALNTALGGR
ncbi:Response regulator receiver domain-containing protein [Desulfacinum hydrothermale DSM 13146]|uniref:Response regulator receiver domain-containing protein n=1 Tax=Desulfacinum hydrothermale DSM 13146 TaxID=1121390 RepID=A0A1W1X9I3_9BACT|nr:response regulator [Desulfacinum hydrothermale]SMC20514.1 Response regulator receiver domain-containing protein [Desulfacinum hydrothermale DSM 13146]